MVASADYNIKYLEDLGFTNMKISLKASDVQRTVEAYRTLRPMNNYPFHLGVTEAGGFTESAVKSSAALGALLYQGIGDTIRVSVSAPPKDELIIGKQLLKSFDLIHNVPDLISCPTCGRIQYDMLPIVKEIEDFLAKQA